MTSQTQTSAKTTKDGLNNGGLPNSNTARPSDSNPGSATEEALMAAERLFGCKIIRQQNPEGRVTFIIATDNGQKLDFDEKGNVFIGAAKVGEDEDGGNMTLRAWGDLTLKVGGKLNLEIENFLDQDKPISITSYGDVNVESIDGHMALGGKNVTVTATNDLTLKGNSIKLQAGEPDQSGACSGTIERAAGKITTKCAFQELECSGQKKETVKGHYTIDMKDDKRSLYSLDTNGHVEIKATGDGILDFGGKFKHKIGGKLSTPIPKVSGDSYQLTVDLGNTATTITKGNHTETLTKGNYDRTLTSGNFTDTITDGNVTRTIGKALTDTITKGYTLTYKDLTETNKGNEIINVTGTSTHDSKGVKTFTSQGIMTIESSSILNIKGTQIFLNS